MPMQRGGQTVPSRQRLGAGVVLAEREARLSALQRLALVDAAASWLSEPDPKIKSGTGERDYRVGVAVLWSRGRGKLWSGGGFEGDLVAQRFELVDVVTFFAFRADAVVV